MSSTFDSDPARALRELVASGRFREALDLHARVIEDPAASRRAEVQLLAATAATRVGRLDHGTSLASEALERFRKRADADGRMRVMNLLGAISFERGELDAAERCFGEALELAHELGDNLIAARASNNLASVAHLRSRPDLALTLYRTALLAYQRLGDRRGAAETYHNINLTFRHLSDWREAENAAAQALRHAELVGERGLLALVITGRAELDLERGDLTVAARELDRAGRLAEEAGDEIGVAEVRRLQARLAFRGGDNEVARQAAEAARLVAERHGSALLQAECAAVAALALRRLGLTEDAERRRAEAIAGFRQLGARHLLDRFEREWE